MKTAISIPDELFKEIEDFAAKHKYSRSEVFVIAVKDFLKRLESRKLLDALNAAYSEDETPEEKTLREAGKKRYAKTVLKEKY